MTQAAKATKQGGFLGSLKDALAAAGREEPIARAAPNRANVEDAEIVETKPPIKLPAPSANSLSSETTEAVATPPPLSASEAAAAVRTAMAPATPSTEAKTTAPDTAPTTRVVRGPDKAKAKPRPSAAASTQLVRGKAKVKRGEFEQDPVVGWLVIVGGPGIGHFRPVFEGNNTLGRSESQRIPIDFGDDAISGEEQAFVRYDSQSRTFLFVPNLSKTNIVSINEKRPTGAVELSAMDVITVGRTQLVFVPFCGPEFDWSELSQS